MQRAQRAELETKAARIIRALAGCIGPGAAAHHKGKVSAAQRGSGKRNGRLLCGR